MSDIYDELQGWLDQRRERQSREQAQRETDERFTSLESKLDTIAEGVTKALKGSSPESPPPEPGGEHGGSGTGAGSGTPNPVPPPPTPEPAAELPVERITNLPVPRIYTGDDEPETVTYIDGETGESKTRKGRRKGRPASYDVQPGETPAEPEGEQ